MKYVLAAALLLGFAAPAHADWWKPTTAGEFQWQIDHAMTLTKPADMGTGQTAYTGAKPPATDPVVYDIDGFSNTAATVAALKAKGFKTVCYIEVGAAENYRPDYSQFPAEALGRKMPGYAAEKYVDIRNATVVAIIKARIQMCASKGFDAIEPDIDESYGARTGFPLTQADEVTYMKTLSDYAHSLGVAYWSKNCDDTGDDYCAKLIGMVDGAISEECNKFNTCSAYTAAWKVPVFNVEYTSDNQTVAKFCPADNARGTTWMGTLFNVNLNGKLRTPCR